MKTNVFDLLQERGFVYQTSNEEGVRWLLEKPGATFYCGFDPSAKSLQIGNLLVIMAMHHLQEAGHHVIYLVGGGTGLIGDPTGKAETRKQLSPEIVSANSAEIRAQVEEMGLLRFDGDNSALMLNNYDWLSQFTFLEDFLMKVARAFSVKEMVKMETFATRLADDTAGLSLLEFLYPVLQAWDFLWLFEKHNCCLQVGGSDQWGNILQGTDLIRRVHRQETFALTFPLLTTASGQKMGKSEQGTIWLDPEMTSPFDFFQYLQGVEDTLVPQLLRLFTFLDLAEIDEVIKDPRAAQLRLALEVTKIVHGEDAAQQARQDFDRLAGRAEGVTESVPTFTLPEGGLELDEILVQAGVLPSKSEVRRRCSGGGIRIDDEKVTDPKTPISVGCVIRFGKGKFLKVELSNAN